MSKELYQITSRDVSPQWGAGKNLGDFTLSVKELNGAGLREMVGESETSANALAEFLNGQLHIRFGGKLSVEKVKLALDDVKSKDEKLPDWQERTHAKAVEVAKATLPGFQPDYVAELRRWITEEYAKRGERKDERVVHPNFDAVIAGVEERWSGWAEERRIKFCNDLGLNPAHSSSTATGVLMAFRDAFKAPTTVMSVDSLLGE